MLDSALADLVLLAKGLLALALGGAVGWERESKGKGAGFRTMMLVAFASFLIVEVSLLAGGTNALSDGALRSDPVRAIQAIITGLGFLGAGIVFRDRENSRTRGLTTAASLLVVSPIGVAVALDHAVLAIGATGLLLLVLGAVERIEDRFV